MENFIGSSDPEFLLDHKLYKKLMVLMIYNRRLKKYNV